MFTCNFHVNPKSSKKFSKVTHPHLPTTQHCSHSTLSNIVTQSTKTKLTKLEYIYVSWILVQIAIIQCKSTNGGVNYLQHIVTNITHQCLFQRSIGKRDTYGKITLKDVTIREGRPSLVGLFDITRVLTNCAQISPHTL